MYALVDCNSFFASVEKVFHPGLEGKPVCVLSSNDGNIVALTPEAKAVGLHRGDPVFKVRDIIEHNDVKLFSTNMMLYAAMSKRVMNIIRQSVPLLEVYSIDEGFANITGCKNQEEMMREIAERIKLYTDIPVSVGVAPTKTLAKIGSKFAKQYKGYRSVCMIDNEEKRRKALALFDLADVWGIGRQTLVKLNYYGITTPLEFADKSESWVKSHLTKPGVQTWYELNGTPCIDTSEVKRNKNICTSRSFGQMITDLDSLKSSVATFASSCANKLRGQRSVAKSVTVFIGSNTFREDLPQYGNSATCTFLTPTADTLEITKAAIQALESIYRPGIMYKRSGVLVSDIYEESPIQLNLFDPIENRKDRAALMKAIDAINQKFGVKTIQLVVEGQKQDPWKTKCDFRTPNYLTDLSEIMTLKI
ncbi:MAG: Y-family DNA polymerase [Paludibacteraceae bacterium]|nr:Y-family DNA polymerase [Paludibacteraceae bacterium]